MFTMKNFQMGASRIIELHKFNISMKENYNFNGFFNIDKYGVIEGYIKLLHIILLNKGK